MLILASSSSARLQLLQQLGLNPMVRSVSIDESTFKGEKPRAYVRRMARQKAEQAVIDCADSLHENSAVIIAADSVIESGGRILHKTDDSLVAESYLRYLSGRRHRVFGGVTLVRSCIVNGETIWHYHHRVVMTMVQFRRYSQAEIDTYVSTQQWRGCAGGYAIQGHAAGWVKSLSGSYTNVVGLDLHTIYNFLRH